MNYDPDRKVFEIYPIFLAIIVAAAILLFIVCCVGFYEEGMKIGYAKNAQYVIMTTVSDRKGE